MTDLEIRLTFHTDPPSGRYPAGYWLAEAGRKGQPNHWDGVGATPLDAMTNLARQMYKAHVRRALADKNTEEET